MKCAYCPYFLNVGKNGKCRLKPEYIISKYTKNPKWCILKKKS